MTLDRIAADGSDNAERLLKLLWREHMSLAFLMPNFDNVAQAIWIQAPWLVSETA